jgi:hypothetical protein
MSRRRRIRVFKRDLEMNDNLDYTFQDFRRSKVYLFSFIAYNILTVYLFTELIQRCIITARKKTVESLSDFPNDCSEFSKDFCVRSNLQIDECRGAKYEKPIVF